jgi:hypothetical protein
LIYNSAAIMSAAFRWRKAVYLILLSAIFLLNLLPWFGWTWHRVLPEHTHLFIGNASEHGDEMLVAPRPVDTAEACANCAEIRVESGILHLPAGIALQLLGLAVGISSCFLLVFDFGRMTRLIGPACLYGPPCLAFPDPPPTGI